MGAGETLLVFQTKQLVPRDDDDSGHPSMLVTTTRKFHTQNFLASGTDWYVFCPGVMPSGYFNGGIDVYIYWTATTAAANDISWKTSFEKIADTFDISTDSFAAAIEVVDTGNVGGADFLQICNTSHLHSEIDGIVAGDSFRLRLERDTGDASDTHAGTAELHMIEIREAS